MLSVKYICIRNSLLPLREQVLPTNPMPTLIASSEDVRVYEIAVMFAPDLDQRTESTLLKDIDQLFADAKAKLLFKDPWSKRGLAYRIGGYDQAKFVIYYYEMDPSMIRELDKQLRLTKGILRHLIVLPPKSYEAVSYEERYNDWMKNRETVADQRKRKKEEKTKELMAVTAKRAQKRKDAAKKEETPAKPLEMKQLSVELDKLISDEDLKM